MPVMDGLQATRLIRSFEESGSWDDATKAGIKIPPDYWSNSHLQEPRKRLPIVAVSSSSAYGSSDFEQHEMRCSYNRLLHKIKKSIY